MLRILLITILTFATTLPTGLYADNFSAQAKIDFPSFSFPLNKKEQITKQDLLGKYYLVNFFFTTCPHICPTINGKVYTLQKSFADHPELHFLSLSVDPERDTFEALDAYAKRFQANRNRWHFARPAKAELAELVKQLKLAVGTELAEHSNRFILVRPDGKIYALYQALNTEDFNQLKKDLQSLLN